MAKDSSGSLRPCTLRCYLCYLLLGFSVFSDLAWSLNQRRVIVVGGGVGGLATAARIAAKTRVSNEVRPLHEVLILEKNPTVGGRCDSFSVSIPGYGIFRHEQGPSLLLLPHIYERLFIDCGSSAEEHGLRIAPCIPAYQVVFDDGDRLNVGFRRDDPGKPPSESELESRATMEYFEEDASKKWDGYMQACQAFLDCGLPNFIEEKLNLKSFPAFLAESLRGWGKSWPLKPHSDVLEAFFDSTKMRALASFQDLYVGLEPYRNDQLLAGGVFGTTAPAVFGLLAAIELHHENERCGVFAPIGGFASVTMALEQLCKDLGVSIRCNQTVTSVSESGVYARGRDEKSPSFMHADLVVVNADLPYVQKSLVANLKHSNTERYDWSDDYKFSSGVISFHWSTNKTLDELNTHNVFLQAKNDVEARKSWSCLQQEAGGQYRFSKNDAYNFYVHRPTKVDPTAAPKGCDSITVLFPCPTLKRQESFSTNDRLSALQGYAAQFDQEAIDGAREVVLQRLAVLKGLKDLRHNILHETVDTPATMANAWNVAAGAPFGINHALSQLSKFRPVSLEDFPNCIFVGASARPGNGVPLVLVGAEQAAERAIQLLNNLETR